MALESPRDIKAITITEIGRLRASAVAAGWEVTDATGQPIRPIAVYLHDLFANDSSPETCRSYGMALLRWWRFLAAIAVEWDEVRHSDFIDYVAWLRVAAPRHGGRAGAAPNPSSKPGFAPRTINHSTAVLTGFYDFHEHTGTGPAVNPARSIGPRPHAHHNPMQPFARSGRQTGRQKIPKSAPKSIPDEIYDTLFSKLRHDRDRALVAFYVSSGARAAELLSMNGEGVDFGSNRILVRRKGGRTEQWIPASPDSFVWLRLYLGDRVLKAGQPVWLTLRQPLRPLQYPAARQVFNRAQEELGTTYTLHQLRHTAAYRMVEDPNLSITDVAWVLNHAWVTTTQLYTQPHPEDVLARMAQHYSTPRPVWSPPPADLGYDGTALETLFGKRHD